MGTTLPQDNDQFTTTLETEAGDDRVVIIAEITPKELDLQDSQCTAKEQQAVITSPTGAATDVEVMAFQSSNVPSIPTLGGTVSAAQELSSVIANVQASESNTEEVVHSVDESPACTNPVLQSFRKQLMNLDSNVLDDFKEDFSHFIKQSNHIKDKWNKRKEDTTSAASSPSNNEMSM